MKSFRHILVSILLIASFVSTAQVRTKIQDYSNVATLQSETLISKDNDKIYVKSINTIFAWNVTSTATHDGINVIKQTNIATGRFIKVNPEIGANVRYGTAIPVVITSDRKGDSYVLTDTGINTGIVQSVWVYDASIWKKTVTITDPVIDFSVNADPNTALTTFSPNLPNTVDVLYRSTIDGSLWSSNAVTYSPSVASTNRTIQSISATGNITAWNSTVQIGATPLTANIVLTLPTNVGSKFRDIVFKRLDATAFTVTIVANGAETVELTTSSTLNAQYGALTLQSISTTKSQQISNIGGSSAITYYMASTTYTAGQDVIFGNKILKRKTAGATPASFSFAESFNWDIVKSFVQDWIPNLFYYTDESMYFNATLFRKSTTSSTSGAIFNNTEAAFWANISNGFTNQTLTATGAANSWNSAIIINSATATVTTLPIVTVADIGKTINVKNIGLGVNTQIGSITDIIQGGLSLAQFESVTFVARATLDIQAISAKVAIASPTIQQLNTTGMVTAWNSTVEIGAIPLIANITITLPTVIDNLLKTIVFKRLDNTAFTVTIVANGAETVELTTSSTLNAQYGALTLQSISTTKSQQISNIGGSIVGSTPMVKIYAATWVNTANTPSNSSGHSFTVPVSGTYIFDYVASAYSATTTQTGTFSIRNGTTILASDVQTSYNNSSHVEYSYKVEVTLTAGVTYNAYFLTGFTRDAADYERIYYKQQSGFLPISGYSGDFISANRTVVQTTGIAVGSPILFNNKLDGNLTQTNGIFSLAAGKTYQLIGNSGITSGDRGLSVRWRNLTSGLLIGSEAATLTPTAGNGNAPFLGSANAILTTTVATTVQLEIVNFLGGSAPSAIGFQADQPLSAPYASIVQIGATPTLANQAVTTGDFPTGGALQAINIDPYVLGFNVAQTTASQVLTIPSPVTTTVNRILYINNTGTADFKIGTITVGISKTVAYIWNGSAWSNFSTEVVGAVASEYGENNTITNGQTTASSILSAITNGTITIPSAGVWNIGYKIYAWQSSSGQTISFVIKDALGNIVANSAGSGSGSSGNANAAQLISQNVNVTTTGATVYTVHWGTAGAGAATLVNTNPTTIAGSSSSKTFYQKVSGYLPVSGSTVDYVLATRSSNQPSFGAVDDMLWNQTISGNIPLNTSTGVFTLTAGNTYELESAIYGTGTGGMNISYVWADAITNVPLANAIIAQATGVTSGNNEISQPFTKIIYTASTNQMVKVRVTNSNNNVVLNAGRSYAKIVQIGSTPTLVNQAVNVSDLPTGGALQATPIDPYILGFNITQTTVNQVLSIPNPVSTSVNRILYINNVGTASFTVSGIAISAGQSGAFIWNGITWSVFSAQASGSVISEYGEQVFGNTGFSSSFVNLTNGVFSLPSAGVWEIVYHIYYSPTELNEGVQYRIVKSSDNSIVTNSLSAMANTGVSGHIDQSITQTAYITTTTATNYSVQGLGSLSELVWSNGASIANSKVSWKKIAGYIPVIGQSVETTYAKQAIMQGFPSNGTPLNFESVDGTTPVTGNTTFTLTPNRTYYLQGASGIMSGTNAGFSVQFYNLTTGAYIGTPAMVTSPASGQTHTPSGGIATLKITPTVATQIQLRITNIASSAGIIGGSALTNTGAGVGSADSPNSANWLKITQEGSSAYSILNTYVGASSTTAGVTGGVPVSAVGDQAKMLMGDGTWMTSTTAINNITPATVSNTINNANFGQNWNWNLVGATTGLNISEGMAQAGGAGATLVKVGTLATSTIKPFTVLAQGNNAIDVSATGLQTFGSALLTNGQVLQSGVTTGNSVNIMPFSLTSGHGVNIASNSTAKLMGSTALNIVASGALSNASVTTYGANITNTHTGTTGTNVGLYLAATGATNNNALITAGGKIGFNTPFPSTLLHLANDLDGANPTFTLSGSNTTAFGTLSAIQLDLGGFFIHQGTLGGIGAKTSLIAGGKTAGNYPSIIAFATTSAGGVQATERMTITGDGFVGVNTTVPIATFQVNGSLALKTTEISTAYTILPSDNIIICNNTVSVTLTLPDATVYPNRVIYVTRDVNSSGVLTLASVSMMQNNAGAYAASITQAVLGTWGSNCQYISSGGKWKRLN